MRRRIPFKSLALVATAVGAVVLASCARDNADEAAGSSAPQQSGPAMAQVDPLSSDANGVARTKRYGALSAEQDAYLALPAIAPRHQISPPPVPQSREIYASLPENGIRLAARTPVSTFGIDIDTGSYANIRRFLNLGQKPPPDAVRVEEMINYFSYDYPAPADTSQPFRVATEIAPTPWNRNTVLLHIGIKAYDIEPEARPRANLVFLIDISGSMKSANKLPLLKSAFRLLTDKLADEDSVAIVTYASTARIALPATNAKYRSRIRAAIDALQPGGGTNGGAGIELAYGEAEAAFIKNGTNRVILATDGDLNVGTVDFSALKALVEAKRKNGVSLTTLGFGMGNYNDRLLEQLADTGNGNHAYIDTLNEGRKVLVEELSGTLFTVAKDVKAQVEFNPAVVAEYRLIGYENRKLAREDFKNDKADAGEIGVGHTVTAIYEIALVGGNGLRLEPLRYQAQVKTDAAWRDELAFIRLRYKAPDGDTSTELSFSVAKSEIKQAPASPQFRFAAAVAGFGQLLKGGKYVEDFKHDDVAALAAGALGADRHGYRHEFVRLVKLAKAVTVAARD